MAVKKYKTRKPTESELRQASVGQLVFRDTNGKRYTYMPEGHSVIVGSEKQIDDNDSDLKIGKVLPELIVEAPAKSTFSDRDTDENLSRRDQIAKEDAYVHSLGLTQPDKEQMNNLANISLLLGGTAAAVPAFITAPLATAGAFAGGMGGNWIGDKLTQYFSNNKYNTWGNAVEGWTNGYIRADNGQFTNPGALLGGAYGVRLGTGQVLRNAVYNNISPFGYTLVPKLGIYKPKEFVSTVVDYFNPFFKLNSNKTPRWRIHFEKNNNLYDNFTDLTKGTVAEFRDQAWRKAMRVPDKEGTLPIYKDNGDGTYSYDFDNINTIRRKYNGPEFNELPIYVDSPHPSIPGAYNSIFTPGLPVGESFVGYDHMTTNGGFGQYTRNNDGSFTFYDKWDLQPFKDKFRQLMPVPKFLRNVEVVKTVGGNPFIVKTEVPTSKVP